MSAYTKEKSYRPIISESELALICEVLDMVRKHEVVTDNPFSEGLYKRMRVLSIRIDAGLANPVYVKKSEAEKSESRSISKQLFSEEDHADFDKMAAAEGFNMEAFMKEAEEASRIAQELEGNKDSINTNPDDNTINQLGDL